MAKRPVTRQALALQGRGVQRGKAWRPIIDRLGFDPRSFVHGTMTLQQGPGGKLQPGTGALHPFKPFVPPTRPPAGTYDPALDAAEGAAHRGLADLVLDTDRGRERAGSDLALGNAEIDRQAGYGMQDLATSESNVLRNFQQLGTAQAGQQRAAGIRGGGVLAAAMKRAENQQLELAPIGVARTRLGENVAQQKGALGLAYQRQGEDMTTGLSRATREDTQFGLDTSAQRFFQATQGGYKVPTAPNNEKTKGQVTYRVKGEGPNRKYTLPNGRQLGRQDWVNLWRSRRRTGAFPVGYGIGV